MLWCFISKKQPRFGIWNLKVARGTEAKAQAKLAVGYKESAEAKLGPLVRELDQLKRTSASLTSNLRNKVCSLTQRHS